MTGGKKLTIALAVAIPLLILGSGLVLAAGDEPGIAFGKDSTQSAYALAPVSTITAAAAADGSCPGLCEGYGSGDCDGDCDGTCDGDCDGDCPGAGACYGECSGAGNCGGTIAGLADGSRRGNGCGRRFGALSDSAPACSSCDVVGLNFEQPILATRA